MKKLSTLFTVVALSATIGLVGCKKKTEEAPAATTTTTTTTTAPAAKPADTAAPAAAAVAPATTAAAAGAAPAAAGSTGIPECDAWKAAVDKLMSCDKMPQEARDATKKGFDSASQAWAQLAAAPADTKKQVGDSCKMGLDGLKQAATAMGCTL